MQDTIGYYRSNQVHQSGPIRTNREDPPAKRAKEPDQARQKADLPPKRPLRQRLEPNALPLRLYCPSRYNAEVATANWATSLLPTRTVWHRQPPCLVAGMRRALRVSLLCRVRPAPRTLLITTRAALCVRMARPPVRHLQMMNLLQESASGSWRPARFLFACKVLEVYFNDAT
jgi:hypothetical protein